MMSCWLFHPLTFDISCFDIFMPLIIGAKLVMADDAMKLEPQRIMQAMVQHEITMMQATPALWQMLVEQGWKASHSMKIISTGEALNSKLAANLIREKVTLWNLYGRRKPQFGPRLTRLKG